MGNKQSVEEHLFNLKFTSKQLIKSSQKMEKQEKAEKNKVKLAIQKGNLDGAKIYAENAIRSKNQALNYLRLSSRIDAVANRVETAVRMNQVTKSMSGIVNGMEQVLKSMDTEKITKLMDKFDTQFQDLDVQSSYMESTMSQTTGSMTPIDQVDSLINQVAEENGLELQQQLDPVPSHGNHVKEQQKDDLSSRLEKLKQK
eukprot:TRINITY_DN1664_c0_g1_i1.p1 TRINITY_DN1664_c0_g1~~TRINITY_DN1664_c0_g1_i1.p1  ORF type:complete len:200 (-),score=63.64 TRINITY_DN1664_c0_g1_i1:94-693(-)